MRIDYSYDDKGQIKSITRYGNLSGTLTVATTDFSYNVDQQITNLLHKNGSSATISSLTFTYDSKHRLTSLNTDGSIATYVYDSTDQVTADGNTTVTYDATGNRNNGSYSTATGNRLSTDGVWNYTYDNEGNLTKKSKGAYQETWLYGYDQINHLISADKWSEDPASMGTPVFQLEADYKYDVFGNRIEKRVDNDGAGAGSANTTKFAYDQWNPAKSNPLGTENADIWGDFTGGSLTTRYVHGDQIDDLLARIDGVDPRWYLKDHLGSIRKVIDNTAAVKDSIAYDAFGNIIAETDAAERGRYAWTSREIDVETALQYNRARYYDSTTGRWISQDPLGFDAGDSNLYRYVTNRPTVATDPSGLDRVWVQPDGRVMWQVETLQGLSGMIGMTTNVGAPIQIGTTLSEHELKYMKIRPTILNVDVRSELGGVSTPLEIIQNIARTGNVAGDTTPGAFGSGNGSVYNVRENLGPIDNSRAALERRVGQAVRQIPATLEFIRQERDAKIRRALEAPRYSSITASPGTPEWWRYQDDLLASQGYSLTYRIFFRIFMPVENSGLEIITHAAGAASVGSVAKQARQQINANVQAARASGNGIVVTGRQVPGTGGGSAGTGGTTSSATQTTRPTWQDFLAQARQRMDATVARLPAGAQDMRMGPPAGGWPTGPISVSQALDLAAQHLGGPPTSTVTSGSGGVQFMRTTTVTTPTGATNTIIIIARFDINPASPHVQVDPATIRPGDY